MGLSAANRSGKRTGSIAATDCLHSSSAETRRCEDKLCFRVSCRWTCGVALHSGNFSISEFFTVRLRALMSQFCLSACPSVRPSVCLSVRLSVCQSRVLWQNWMMHCGYFDNTRNGNHSSFLTPTMVGGRCPFPLKSALKVTHPFEKSRLRPISAHNASTIRDSEKSSITTNIKSTTGFQRAIDGVRTLPLSALKGGPKSDFFVSWVKVNGWSSQALST